MDLRISVKIGNIQVDFEGSNETFAKSIEPILNDLVAFGKQGFNTSEANVVTPKGSTKAATKILPMTVKSIAAKLGGNSGSTLLYAAIASLAIIKNKETLTRQEINEEMKQAVGYYKNTYTGNLSSYLDTLAKEETIFEISKDTYAVKDTARATMEQKLAQ